MPESSIDDEIVRIGKLPPLRPEVEDERDMLFAAEIPDQEPLDEFDLRGHFHPVLKQEVGSCASHAAAQVLYAHVQRLMDGWGQAVLVSPMDLYYHVRRHENTYPEDSGSTIRGIMHVLRHTGGIPYYMFESTGNYIARPPDFPKRMTIRNYHRILGTGIKLVENVKKMISVEKMPVLGGFRIPAEQLRNRRVMSSGDFQPAPVSYQDFYGHAMVICGYRGNRFILNNSWGTDVGQSGYFACPFQWLENPFTTISLYTIDPAMY